MSVLIPFTQIQITQQSVVDEKGITTEKREKIFVVNFCNNYEINNSYDNLTDTAKVVLPRKIKIAEYTSRNSEPIYTYQIDKKLIKYGDKIQITGGYFKKDGTIYSEKLFDGFITKVSFQTPITIEAENYMYVLKHSRCPNLKWNTKIEKFNLTKKEGKLEFLIKYLFDICTYKGKTLTSLGFDFLTDNTNTNVGEWIVSASNTVAQFLEEIKSKLKFTIFMDDTMLYCGIVKYNSRTKNTDPIVFCFSGSKGNIIENSLEFVNSEDLRIKLVAVGIKKEELNGKKKEKRVEEIVGDFDGEMKTWHCLDDFPDAQPITGSDKLSSLTLKEKALAVLPKYKLTKATGSFTTFGFPRVVPGNIITLEDADEKRFNANNNQYLVKAVTTTGGVGGMRQIISLDYCYSSLSDEEKQNYELNKGFYKNSDLTK